MEIPSSAEVNPVTIKSIQAVGSVGDAETKSFYVIVTDADAVYKKAMAAGAIIAVDVKNEEYGGRGFSCNDPEGLLRSF